MRLNRLTMGLTMALVGCATVVQADDNSTSMAIRWLGDTEAVQAFHTQPDEQLATPVQPAPMQQDANEIPMPLPPVIAETPAVAPVVTALPKPVVQPATAVVPPVSAIKPTPAAVASKPIAITTTRQTKPIGGRWMVPVANGKEATLAKLLADPFNERRPPHWNPLYRAGNPQNPVRLMGDTTPRATITAPAATYAAADIVPVNFASQASACGSQSCGSSVCGSSACGSASCGCRASGCSSCGSGCVTSGCRGGAGCCGPTWSAGVDALFLWRDAPNAVGPLVECDCEENIYFAPSGFDLGNAAAPRFRLFRHSPGGNDIEVAYYNFDSWDNHRHFYGDLIVFGTDLGSSASAGAHYESQLQSLEINLLRCHGCWTKLITGFRWVQLDESASVYGTNGTTTVSRCAHTTNNLYGGHFGFRRLLYDYGGCLTLDSTVKAGVFGSDVDRDMCVDGYSAPSLSNNGVSFIGDVEFQANFEITCRCTLTAGYQMLWITGLASAAEQFEAPSYVNAGETTFFHGANVGMVYTW